MKRLFFIIIFFCSLHCIAQTGHKHYLPNNKLADSVHYERDSIRMSNFHKKYKNVLRIDVPHILNGNFVFSVKASTGSRIIFTKYRYLIIKNHAFDTLYDWATCALHETQVGLLMDSTTGSLSYSAGAIDIAMPSMVRIELYYQNIKTGEPFIYTYYAEVANGVISMEIRKNFFGQ